jgi:protein-L-isoaspartate(D-aspartate) O-methyltransferase
VLSSLAAEVYGIELEPELHARSVTTLARLGIRNVHLRQGDGAAGWKEAAPFDAILLSCAAEEIPDPLWAQLREGGRLLYPRGPAGGVQDLVLVRKVGGARVGRQLEAVRFVPLRPPP